SAPAARRRSAPATEKAGIHKARTGSPSPGGGGSIGARKRADRGGVTAPPDDSPHPASLLSHLADPPPPGQGETTAAPAHRHEFAEPDAVPLASPRAPRPRPGAPVRMP